MESGTKLAHYTIVRRLASGGMGDVWLAEDTRLRRHVAIKTLRRADGNPQSIRRLLQEARAASALSHPNVAHIYDVGESDGAHWIAMEYVEGEPLTRVIGGRPVCFERLLQIGIQISDALGAAHGKNIVHRDLKPGNVMVDQRDHVKVLDFGLAKLQPESDDSTETVSEANLLIGTVPYMSPEQAMGQVLDHRSDIFSFGSLLYEMSTGKRPFGGASAVETLHQIAHAAPAPLTGLTAPELSRIITKCLSKKRDERYQSAREIAIDLARLKQDSESGSRLVPAAPQRWNRRYVIAASAPLGLAAAAGAWYWLRPANDGRPAIQALAILPLKSLGGEDDSSLEVGIADTLIMKVSQIRSLTVRPTSAVRKYATQHVDGLQAGRELKVDAVLEGTLQKSGERLRVGVNLLNVATGGSLWAESFDVQFRDVFAVQDEVSREVVSRLRVRLNPEERKKLDKQSTTNSAAYEYYLAGRALFEDRSLSAPVAPAVKFFEKAVATDANYALAHAYLAYAYLWMGLFVDTTNLAWVKKAREALQRAEELDSELPENHIVRHELYWSAHEKFRLVDAVRELRKAIELNPIVGHGELGILYAHMGLERQALRELDRSIEVDPTSAYSRGRRAEGRELLGNWDTSEESQRVGEGGSASYLALGRLDEAQRRLEAALSKEPQNPRARSFWALLLALRGRFREALAQIPLMNHELNRGYHHVTLNIACIHGLQRSAKEAVHWLKRTAEMGMPNYTLFTRLPHLDPIRKQPEFVQFMSETKLLYERYNREFL